MKYFLFLINLILLSCSVEKKNFNLIKNQKKILQCIISSPQFFEIYPHDNIVFFENELLNKLNLDMIKKSKNKIYILNKVEIDEMKADYVVLSSFIYDKTNFYSCSVQIFSSYNHKNLNIYLRKKDNTWLIANYSIFDD